MTGTPASPAKLHISPVTFKAMPNGLDHGWLCTFERGNISYDSWIFLYLVQAILHIVQHRTNFHRHVIQMFLPKPLGIQAALWALTRLQDVMTKTLRCNWKNCLISGLSAWLIGHTGHIWGTASTPLLSPRRKSQPPLWNAGIGDECSTADIRLP